MAKRTVLSCLVMGAKRTVLSCLVMGAIGLVAIFGGDRRRLSWLLASEEETRKLQGRVNGGPMIMGLSGQLFRFEGRSGDWYSAISTSSFQWNMRLQSHDTCPGNSNNFVTGVGLTFVKQGQYNKQIEVTIGNHYSVDVGCGGMSMSHCLGAGSLEVVIDGKRHVVGGDYKFHDGTGRIVAFNTFYPCSRRWYEFDVHHAPTHATDDTMPLPNGRHRTTHEPNAEVFDVIKGLKDTMIDKEVCEKWIDDRRKNGDLFQQLGHYTTVVIHTDTISLHMEYKQENDRCRAHSLHAWVSSVSPLLLEQTWEGVIGETKDLSYKPQHEQPKSVHRLEALKYDKDSDYEVRSPFSTRCKGCIHS